MTFILVSACKVDKTPLKSYPVNDANVCDSVSMYEWFSDYISKSKEVFTDKDTLEVVPGVVLICKGVTGEYALNEPITGTIVLKNISCDTAFSGTPLGSPYYMLWVEDSLNNLVDYSPKIQDPNLPHYRLEIGDSVKQSFSWHQHPYKAPPVKVPTGRYHLYISIEGHDSLYHRWIRKKITLLPQGDRFASSLQQNFHYPDCYIYDFFITNRFPDETTLVVTHPNPIELHWTTFQDSLIAIQYLPFQEEMIHIPGHTTWKYRFQLNPEDSEIQALMSSAYYLKVIIHTTNRDFTGEYPL
ncbi:MAG: hypothetical protein D6748_07375 [Calditrichaeota bacterium]|nr:MAG: hypothetical protein D6748_07375 [Calditrichota bacterium]